MPISHVIDHVRQRMETIAEGPVTWADLVAHWEAEVAEGGHHYPEVVDGSRASIEFTPHDVRHMIEMLRVAASEGPLGPTAVIIRTEFGFGMLRMFGMLVEPFCEIVPFRDRASAEAWLASVRNRL